MIQYIRQCLVHSYFLAAFLHGVTELSFQSFPCIVKELLNANEREKTSKGSFSGTLKTEFKAPSCLKPEQTQHMIVLYNNSNTQIYIKRQNIGISYSISLASFVFFSQNPSNNLDESVLSNCTLPYSIHHFLPTSCHFHVVSTRHCYLVCSQHLVSLHRYLLPAANIQLKWTRSNSCVT